MQDELQTPAILYSEYVKEDSRLRTFTGIRNPAFDSRELAAAGFFYTGGQVVCFWCGHGLKNWTMSDDPWYCHLKQSPHCGFLAFALREVDLNAYKERIRAEQTTLQCLPEKQAQQGNEQRQRYTTFKTRVLTFSKWTKPTPTPQKLAEAGFYYTGESDIVRCFHCRVGLGDWNDGEDPWIEHAKLFPCCGFVIRNKGFNFIQSVQNDLQNEGVAAAQVPEIERAIQTPRNDETLETNPFNSGDIASVNGLVESSERPLPWPCGLPAPRSINQDEVPMRESDNPIYSQAAQAVINLGFSKAAVCMAIEKLNSEGTIWDANVLVEWLFENQHRCKPQECLQRRSLSIDFIRDDLPETSEETVRQINILKTRITCYRCEVREANILFVPCAHVRACQECSVEATVCFLCKEEIKEKIKIYR